MATSIISVSVPQDLAVFLSENEDLSPSKMLQQRILDIKNDREQARSQLKAMEIRNGRLAQNLERAVQLLHEKNIPFEVH